MNWTMLCKQITVQRKVKTLLDVARVMQRPDNELNVCAVEEAVSQRQRVLEIGRVL